MKQIIDLVDTVEYTTTNCFAHQLHAALHKIDGVETVALADIGLHPRPDLIVSRLKQRTLYRVAKELAEWARDTPVVVFDQDPWEAFRDGSPYKGSYQHIASYLNVERFAVTTRWWADFVSSRGLPSTFVQMWLLPEYCDSTPEFIKRQTPAGFIGSLHGYRKQLFDLLEEMGSPISTRGGGLGYAGYLEALSSLQCFVHSEDAPFEIDGQPANLNVGLWIKDVEAAGRGCFSVRNRGSDSASYLKGIKTVRLYDDPKEIPGIMADIQKMDPVERQATIDETVRFIRSADRWQETVKLLVLNRDQ